MARNQCQLISNTVTALVIIPVAIAPAQELDVGVTPVPMRLNVTTSAALLTPVARPANVMVTEPGGCRSAAYWKLSIVVVGWYFVVAVFLVPLIWSL